MKSIRVKLLLSTLLLVLLSLGIAGLLSYYTTKGIIEQRHILEEFKQTLNGIDRELASLFYEREKDGRELASVPLFERWFFHGMILDKPGADENKHALETLARYSFQQGLSVRQVPLAEMFAKPTYELTKI